MSNTVLAIIGTAVSLIVMIGFSVLQLDKLYEGSGKKSSGGEDEGS